MLQPGCVRLVRQTCRLGVKNGYAGRSTGTSAVPQIADHFGAPRKSAEVGQERKLLPDGHRRSITRAGRRDNRASPSEKMNSGTYHFVSPAALNAFRKIVCSPRMISPSSSATAVPGSMPSSRTRLAILGSCAALCVSFASLSTKAFGVLAGARSPFQVSWARVDSPPELGRNSFYTGAIREVGSRRES
jgi:hypothetical protein